MKATVFLKAGNDAARAFEGDRITLEAPSVVHLQIGPEQVARFERDGADLVLVLEDGTVLVVANFFVQTEEGRNDLVFEDGNDVTWWAQYGETWTGFDIAEINEGLIAPLPWWPLAGLGLLGLGVAAGAGGSDGPAPNTPPEAAADPVATPANTPVSGQVVASDPDGDTLSYTVTSPPGHGSVTMNPDGSYTYVPEPGYDGPDSFEVVVDDGRGGTAVVTVPITVIDVPDISGEASGDVVEDITLDTSGQLDIADLDPAKTYSWSVEGGTGTWGILTVDGTGEWTYVLDNGNPAVQALAQGETLTDTITVRLTDGDGYFSDQLVEITITGTNDAPVISLSSDLAASVTELVDGDPDENTLDHVQNGTIRFSDVDASDTHTADAVAQGPGYLGDFTLGGINSATGELEWSFSIDDADLDSLGAGDVLTQQYLVTIADPNGGTDTALVTVTINGANDRPEPADDASLVAAGAPAALDVLSNDTDDDAGETATLVVTQVDGQPIAPGGSVTLTDGSGTVSLSGAGNLTFTPAPGVTGQVVVSYTVDDGSGTANASAGADWVINIAAVDISDNASPADPATPDDVLSQVDDLAHVAIDGVAAVGGSVTGLTISDGTNSVIVPAGSITVQPDGTYSVTADLGGLNDGTLTVTAEVEDAAGNTVTTTDTITKDTGTYVAIDPVLIEQGVAPTITGTGEPGASVTLTVEGTSYPATVQPDGTWSVTLPGPLGTGEIALEARAVDAGGNTATTDRTVTGLTITDTVAGQPEDISVAESGLPGGSDAGSGTDSTTSSFVLPVTVSALSEVVIGGTVSGGALSGGTSVTLAQLENAGTAPVAIPTVYGVLTITGYDAATGTVSYSYALDGNTDAHSDSSANDILRESIQIAAVESDGDIRVDHLVVAVVDDAPETPVADTPASVTEGGAAVGSASGGTNLLANDTLGADGGRVHQVTYTNDLGVSATVTIPEGGAQTVSTLYGSLTVNSDGSWAYTPDASVDHVKPANDTALRDDFSYTTIDGDGDISPAAATQQITVTDTVPVLGTPENASIDEAHLATGSDPDASARAVSGALDLTPGQDGVDVKLTTASAPAGLQSEGVDLRYVLSADGHTLTADTGVGTDTVFVVTLNDPTSASAGYTFELLRPLDHDGAPDIDLLFGVEVTDSDGDTDTADFTVTVVDDAPETTISQTVDEDSGGFSYNISADATADNTTLSQGGFALTGSAQPDGSMEYKTEHGTVTVSPTGGLSYVPDPNFSGHEEFAVSTTDDGTTGTTTVAVDVTPVSDPATIAVASAAVGVLEDTTVGLGLTAPVIVDDGTGTGNNTLSERIGEITLSGLPAGATLIWGGSSHVVGASGAVTILLSDYPSDKIVAGASGDVAMTTAEFEALQVQPPANSSTNFEVTYSVTSYEVDASGTKLAGVDGATATESVKVYVRAVTDPATLGFDTTVTAATVANADAITFTGTTQADVTLKEDTTFNLSQLLSASFTDLDGSELRSVSVTNTTGADIVVNGATLADGDTVTISAPALSTSTSGLPAITIGGGADFSGDLNGITVTLNARDRDADGYLDGGSVVTGPVNGLAEADTSDNSVTLNLHVAPVADDVRVVNAAGNEDTGIAFLAGLGLSDTSAGAGGAELITALSFDVPAGWTIAASTVVNAASVGATAVLSGTTYTITFTSGSEAEREAYLDGFTIKPPAHDSRDAAIELSVSTSDSATVDGSLVTDTSTATYPLVVQVNPVAELVGGDSDGDGTADLTMTAGFSYTTPANEDAWFNLNSDGFSLSTGWNNQDAGEETFARLTPELIAGDGIPADAIGSQFRWVEGGVTKVAVFDGTPVDVPVSALDTLEFRAVDNFSGQFNIKVQAYAVDTDDDGGAVVTAVSGEAYLSNVLISPVADQVTLALASRTQGYEDTEIPLVIRPTSSDPSESFTVTISDIPAGAVLTYNGAPLTITGGSVTIENFDISVPFTILPPPNSNVDFPLTVTSKSVDRLVVGSDVYVDESAPISLTMTVDVKGVADAANVVTTPQTYQEDQLDSGTATVLLSDLLSVALTDVDGSEALSVQVTGLPDGFGLSVGTLMSGPGVTGEDRIWVLSAAQIGTAVVTVPLNFSGQVAFDVLPVTTENDGASLTGAPNEASFTVTPSPEAVLSDAAVLIEDQLMPINLGIVHQNGDTDETLDSVLIRVSDVTGADFTLFVGAPGAEVEISAASLTIVNRGGEDYYELSAVQAAQLSAQGAANLDGDLGGFDLFYKITDPGDGSVSPVTSDWTPGHFDLSATPVTDLPVLGIDSIEVGGTAQGGTSVTVDTAGTEVMLDLNIATPDSDGSEYVVRVIFENVPAGVTVEGAQLAGPGLWLLVLDGSAALPVNDVGGIVLPVVLTVGGASAGLTDAPIRVTVQTQDRGDQAAPGTAVLSDSTEWTLTTTFAPAGSGAPPTVDTWEYTGASATEDTSFLLSQMITAEVTAQSASPSILTVKITDLPPGTEVSGMVSTVVGGQQIWTASIVTAAGDDVATVQAKLDALMDSIVVTPAANANDNNLADPFTFNAELTSASAGGGESEISSVAPVIPIDPVTDPATVEIALGAADADGVLTETDSAIPLTVTVSNPADGAAGVIEGGQLYLQIDGSDGLGSGTLTVGGAPVVAQVITGVAGIPDGTYYVIDSVAMNTPLDLVFTPDTMTAGDLTVDAWVRNVETGAPAMTSTGSVTLSVEITNDGVTLTTGGAISGPEASTSDNSSLIPLDLNLTLTDMDGSEAIKTVLLSNLPEGFLLYTGTDASDASLAQLAVNAGGVGGTNTWLLVGEGDTLPAYIAILPPQHWSGALDSLSLTVTSGETGLSSDRVDVLAIGDVTVTPVANGIALSTTNSFGREGAIVPLNLNASMVDSEDASVAVAPDSSLETTTLELQGLGEFASFYVGTTILTSNISYDAGSDTYTLSGLSQSDLDDLGVRQAANALTDTDPGLAGVQISVTARTVDGADVSADAHSTITLNLSAQLPTTGNDSLIWTGGAINGRAGEDTVQLRYGESLTGSELAAHLSNIETLDLGISGTNEITGLTPDQVAAMTDADNLLTIHGTVEDAVELSGSWTDNGDGTYTGAVAGGGSVTLTVEDAAVTAEVSGFAVSAMMSFMAADAGSFGLAALEADPAPDHAAVTTDAPSYEDVLMTDPVSDDLSAALPEETGTGGAMVDSGSEQIDADPSASSSAGLILGQTLEDELHAAAMHEV